MKFSANLGFLWSHLPLIERIHAARAAGFDAVECHWPYDTPVAQARAALERAGLPMLGLNTRRGKVEAGENGLAALPGREAEAREAIDEAVAYAQAVGAKMVHVMSGNSSGPKSRNALVSSLDYACCVAGDDITILIEPLNPYNAPGYYLNGTQLAAEIIREVGRRNLKLMFDCYHVQIIEGDVTRRMESLLPMIGHIQIASVPDRGPPDHGELDYNYVLDAIEGLGWDRPIGAEFVQPGRDAPDLGWLDRYRN